GLIGFNGPCPMEGMSCHPGQGHLKSLLADLPILSHLREMSHEHASLLRIGVQHRDGQSERSDTGLRALGQSAPDLRPGALLEKGMPTPDKESTSAELNRTGREYSDVKCQARTLW